MREIKFRVWDFQTKTWATEHDTKLSMGLTFGVNDWFDNGGSDKPKIRFHFLQFTGLKDKNGKEIYEGDKIKIWNGNKSSVWHDGFQFMISKRPMKKNEAADCEVTGNIYENRELLKP